MTEDEWLSQVLTACVTLGVAIARQEFSADMLKDICDLFDMSPPITPVTMEVKNLLASITVTRPQLIARNETVQFLLVERLLAIKNLIKHHTTTP
jgi:hypothetical protein